MERQRGRERGEIEEEKEREREKGEHGGTEKERKPVAALTQIILVFLPEDTFQV